MTAQEIRDEFLKVQSEEDYVEFKSAFPDVEADIERAFAMIGEGANLLADGLSDRGTEMEQEIQSLKKELSIKDTELGEEQRMVIELEGRLGEMGTAKTELEENCEGITNDLAIVEKELEYISEIVHQLESEATVEEQQADTIIDKLEEKFSVMQEELDNTEQVVKDCRAEIAELKSENKTLLAFNDAQASDLRGHEEPTEEEHILHDPLHIASDALEEPDEQEQTVMELQTELLLMSKAKAELEDKVASFDEECNELQSENEQLNRLIEELESELSETKERIELLEDEVEHLKAEGKDEYQQLAQKNMELEEEKEEVDEESELLVNELESAKAREEELKIDLERREDELEKLRQYLENHEQANLAIDNRPSEDLNLLEQEIKDLETENQDLQEQIFKVNEEEAKNEQELSEELTSLQRACRELRTEVQSKESEILLVRQELDEIKLEYDSAIVQTEILRPETAESIETIQQITEELIEARDALESEEIRSLKLEEDFNELEKRYEEGCTQSGDFAKMNDEIIAANNEKERLEEEVTLSKGLLTNAAADVATGQKMQCELFEYIKLIEKRIKMVQTEASTCDEHMDTANNAILLMERQLAHVEAHSNDYIAKAEDDSYQIGRLLQLSSQLKYLIMQFEDGPPPSELLEQYLELCEDQAREIEYITADLCNDMESRLELSHEQTTQLASASTAKQEEILMIARSSAEAEIEKAESTTLSVIQEQESLRTSILEQNIIIRRLAEFNEHTLNISHQLCCTLISEEENIFAGREHSETFSGACACGDGFIIQLEDLRKSFTLLIQDFAELHESDKEQRERLASALSNEQKRNLQLQQHNQQLKAETEAVTAEIKAKMESVKQMLESERKNGDMLSSEVAMAREAIQSHDEVINEYESKLASKESDIVFLKQKIRQMIGNSSKSSKCSGSKQAK